MTKVDPSDGWDMLIDALVVAVKSSSSVGLNDDDEKAAQKRRFDAPVIRMPNIFRLVRQVLVNVAWV